MANQSLFKSITRRGGRRANAVNEAGSGAYAFSDKHALAQYAATGCMNSTFYASAETQMETILELCQKVDPAFLARAAVYCRQHGYMKDTPALMLAVLSLRDAYWFAKAAPMVLDNGRMVRNFVQIVRSGVVGRKSLGSLPKRIVREWFAQRSPQQLFRDSVGNSPSIADVIKMVHPKPADDEREALYAYLLGRDCDEALLPQVIRDFETYKKDRRGLVPKVPFQMLTSLELGEKEWTQIAMNAGWQMTRMNLNTFARNGVFKNKEMTKIIASRLRDRNAIKASRVFPYQLFVAWRHASDQVPGSIRTALHDAMEAALANVPRLPGRVVVCPDVSGSMHSPVTGHRKGSTSAVSCVDVAAITASAILQRNPDAIILPFDYDVREVNLNRRGSVIRNAQILKNLCGGATNCSAPLRWLNRHRIKADTVIYVSDNQSWIDNCWHDATETMKQWTQLKKTNPAAKMVCIDIQPYGTTQAQERKDIMNIGGFSDRVFSMINAFANGEMNADHWVGEINNIQIN